jgi:16S rRNA (guanine527-N7)-methyltransferase
VEQSNVAVLSPAAAGADVATLPSEQDDAWRGLAAAARGLGVPLDAEAAARLARYRDLLAERGKVVNLTAVRAPEEIERRLFLDALAMVPDLERACEALVDHDAPKLIDIGSGGGVPGLVLKIARPRLEVTLVDATGKKVAFLREVIADLGLASIRAVQGRAEELGRDPAYREQFDLATARAVATLPVLLEYVAPFLDEGGVALLPKGLAIEEELAAGRRAGALLGVEIVSSRQLPVEDTRLVIARKVAPTASAYPRRTGLPSQRPLGEGA